MSEPVECRHIRVSRLRGIQPPGFELSELSSGINLVYGPNASGKSTLAIALQRLLWPRDLKKGDEMLGASFALDDREWSVTLDAGRIQIGGDQPEEIPSYERRGRYHLYLHELLDATNEAFAKRIHRDALGGFDVPAAIEALGFEERTPRAGKSTERVDDALSSLRDVETAQRELRERERKLESLREELSECKRAGERVELLESVLQIKELQVSVDEKRRRLNEFDDRHQKIDGTEAQQAEELRDALREAEAQREQTRREFRQTQQELEELELPEEGIDEEELLEAERRVERLQSLENELVELRRELDDEEAKLDRKRRRELSSIVDPERAEQAPIDDGGRLETFLGKVVQRAERQRAHRVFKETFHRADAPDESELREHREAIRKLGEWLDARRMARDASGDGAGSGNWAGLVASVVGAVGGIVVAVWLHWLGWLLVAAAVVCAIWWYIQWSSTRPEQAGDRPVDPETVAETFERDFDIEPPESWTRDGVRARIREVRSELTDAAVDRQFEETWRAHKSSFGDDDEADIDELRRELASSMGVEPAVDGSNVALVRAVLHLDEYQRATDEIDGLRAGIERVCDERDAKLSELSEILSDWGAELPSSVEQAAATVQTMRQREERRRKLNEELDATRSKLADCEEDVDEKRTELDEVYRGAGVEIDDFSTVRKLCDAHEKWQSVKEDVEELEQKLEFQVEQFQQSLDESSDPSDGQNRNEQTPLEDLPDPPWEATESVLEAERDAAEADADRVSTLQTRITETEHDIRQARASNDLERARAKYRECRDELGRERREDYKSRAGFELASFLHERTRDRELPDVFHRARDLFSKVTRGAYRLELETSSQPGFQAWDTVAERQVPLDHLSSGTRLQLLLTVRMAFTERGERGIALPMVFDETLANSDDLRAGALIDAISDIARRGRQVFYLTAQADEVAQWQRHCGSSTAPDLELHRLQGRGDEATSNGVSFDDTALEWRDDVEVSVAAPERLPSPEGHTHASYGKALELERWHPRDPLGSLHLWYIVDDLELLHDLLEAGVRSWGQLRTLGPSGASDVSSLGRDSFATIEARARAVEAFAEAWKRGRGAPVDREVLEESGAVSDNFIDEVAELCADCEGSAREIIDGLEAKEVKRFRSSKIEELRDYFREHGYLVDEERLDPEEIRTEVIAAVSADVGKERLGRSEIGRLIERLST